MSEQKNTIAKCYRRPAPPTPPNPQSDVTTYISNREIEIAKFAYQVGAKSAVDAFKRKFAKTEVARKVKYLGDRILDENDELYNECVMTDLVQAFFIAARDGHPCPVDVEISKT